jgi:hypothetical protein
MNAEILTLLPPSPATSALGTALPGPLGAGGASVVRSTALTPSIAAGEAVRLLRAGHVDAGMRAAIAVLAQLESERRLGLPDSGIATLLAVLRENPFFAPARVAAPTWPGGALFVDAALELLPMSGDTTALGFQMYRWLIEHAQTFNGLRARRSALARSLDRCAERHPGAPALALFAGNARELGLSAAVRAGQLAVHLLDYDGEAVASLEATWRALPSVRPQRASLASLLAGRCRLRGCGLIYAPSLTEHFPEETLEALLGVLAHHLAPGAELVLPAWTRVQESGLLACAAEWQPRVWTGARLLALVRDLDDIGATVEEDRAAGLAFLHLRSLRASTPEN